MMAAGSSPVGLELGWTVRQRRSPVVRANAPRVVDPARVDGRDVVGQAPEVLLPLALPLLAEGVDSGTLGSSGPGVGVEDDVIAVGVGGEEAVDPAGPDRSFSRHDPVEERPWRPGTGRVATAPTDGVA